MPQSLSNILIHAVFSTSDRIPFLEGERMELLWAYSSGLMRQLDCPSIQIGGRPDHIHVLFRLSRTTPVASIIKEFKTSTTKWLKPQHESLSHFSWQAGYAAFSVSARDVEMIQAYIANQERHHERYTFEDELRAILRKESVEFDEIYLWE